MSRIILGAAQFGMHYGVANAMGKVKASELKIILNVAQSNGINLIDTAISYGDSECALGAAGLNGWQVITKLAPPSSIIENVEAWVSAEVEGSLRRLGVDRLYGLLLHQSSMLLGAQAGCLWRALELLKKEGLIHKIGISIYNPEELRDLWLMPELDLIQLPLNVLDKRIIDTGWLKRLQSHGIEIHARSIFLQGLLLMPINEQCIKFHSWTSVWKTWHNWLERHNLTPLQACLRYALSIDGVDCVVIGIDSAFQLEEILQAIQSQYLPPLPVWPCRLSSELINPSLWMNK